MKRPFFCVGFGMLAAMAVSTAFYDAAPILTAACAAAAILLINPRLFPDKKHTSAAVVLLSAAVGAAMYMGAAGLYVIPLTDELDGAHITFSGVITSEPYTYDGTTRFSVRTTQINGEKKRLNIKIYTSFIPRGRACDYIEGECVLRSAFDKGIGYSSYLSARDTFFSTYISSFTEGSFVVTKNNHHSFEKYFADMRRDIYRAFTARLPQKEASLCIAMITGEKDVLDDDVISCFNTLGIAHLIVVSGLHLAVVAGALYVVCESLIKIRRLACVVQIAGAFAFAELTGFGFSVRRAMIMCIVLIAGKMFYSKDDSLNTLGFAAMIICMNPLAAGDIGLLWSFSCTLSVILLSKKIEEFLYNIFASNKIYYEKKDVRPGAAALCLAASVGSLPFFLLVTKEISPYMLLANLLTVPVSMAVLVCGGLAAVFTLCGLSVFASVPMMICGFAAKYLLIVTEQMADLPFAGVTIESKSVIVFFAVSAAVLLLLHFVVKKDKLFSIGLLAMAFLLVTAVEIKIIINGTKVTMSVLDVGSGMAVTLRYGDNRSVLSSYGEKKMYGSVEEELSGSDHLLYMIDLPPEKYGYDYGRRIIADYTPEAVLCDEKRRSGTYSWYEYCGGTAETIDGCEIFGLPEGNTLQVFCDGNASCEYLTLFGNDILICDGSAEGLPENFCSPDIAVLRTTDHADELSPDTKIIISDPTCQSGDSRIISAADGSGNIDVDFHRDGTVSIHDR